MFNRKNKLNKDGRGTVDLVIYNPDEKRNKFIAIDSVISSHWDLKNNCLSSRHPQYLSRRKVHDAIKNKYEEFELSMRASGDEFRVDMFDAMGKSSSVTFFNGILSLVDDIDIAPLRKYIAFKKNKKNFADIHLQKNNVKIWINAKWGEIKDSKGLAEDVSRKGHYGNGHYEINISNDSKLEYVLSLIKDSIKLNS